MLGSPHTPVALGILGTNEFHLQLLFWARTCLHPAGLCSHLARSLSIPLTCPQTQISWGTDSYRHLWSVIHPPFSRVSAWVYHMIYPLIPSCSLYPTSSCAPCKCLKKISPPYCNLTCPKFLFFYDDLDKGMCFRNYCMNKMVRKKEYGEMRRGRRSLTRTARGVARRQTDSRKATS